MEEKNIFEEKIIRELKVEMLNVSPSSISEWNIDKAARRDRQLSPIFVPF